MSFESDIPQPAWQMPAAQTGQIAPPVAPRTPGTAAANLVFFLTMILFNVGAVIFIALLDWPSIWFSFLAEITVIAGLPLLFSAIRKYDFKATFSLSSVSIGTIGICILIGLVTQFFVRFWGLLWQWLLQFIGPLNLPDDNELSGGGLLGAIIFSVSTLILAPICEEILNRGFMLAGYRQTGFVRCLLMVGLFFGLFHQYPYRLVDTAIAGLVMGYLVLSTGSLYTSIAAHFGFNLLPTLVLWFQEPLNQMLRESGSDQKVGQSPNLTFDLVMSTLGLSLLAGGILFLLLRLAVRREQKRRPGLVLNYNGLAVNYNDNAAAPPLDAYSSPAAPYLYGPYGYVPANQVESQRSKVEGQAPEAKNQNPKSKIRNRNVSIFLFVLILLAFAYSSSGEIRARINERNKADKKDVPVKLNYVAPEADTKVYVLVNKVRLKNE